MKPSICWRWLIVAVVACFTCSFADEIQPLTAERRISVSQYYDQSDDAGAAAAAAASAVASSGGPDVSGKSKSSPNHYKREDIIQQEDDDSPLSSYHNSQYAKQDTIGVGSVEDADISGLRKGAPQFVRGSVVSPEEPGEEAQESINTGTYNHRVPQYIHATPGLDLSLESDASIKNRVIGNYVPSYSSQTNHYSPSDYIQDPSYQLDFKYHDYDKLTKFLRTTSARYPNLTALYSIGKSVQGKRNSNFIQDDCRWMVVSSAGTFVI